MNEHEQLVVELVRETARQGTDEVMKHVAPIIDMLVGEDRGPYAVPSDSPHNTSVQERLEDLQARGHIRVKKGDQLTPGVQADMARMGQPLPRTDGEGHIVGSPPERSAQDLIAEQDLRYKIQPLDPDCQDEQPSDPDEVIQADATEETPNPIVGQLSGSGVVYTSPAESGLSAAMSVDMEPTPEQIAEAQKLLDSVNRRAKPSAIGIIPSAAPQTPSGFPSAPSAPRSDLDDPIAELDIHRTAKQALLDAGIVDMSDLGNYTRMEISKLRGVGPNSLAELSIIMRHEGFRFKRVPDRKSHRKR